jgi:hypothetical protein
VEVPEYVAIFLLGKNLAEYGDGTKERDPFF